MSELARLVIGPQCANAVVVELEVLHREHGAESLCVFQEQRVVARAQAHDDVQVGAGVVEHLRLVHGVAHDGLGAAARHVYPQVAIRHATDLANGSHHLEAMGAQHFRSRPRFGSQADARCDADLARSQLAGEYDSFLHVAELQVAGCVHRSRRCLDDAAVLLLGQAVAQPLLAFELEPVGRAECGTWPVLELASVERAVYASRCCLHGFPLVSETSHSNDTSRITFYAVAHVASADKPLESVECSHDVDGILLPEQEFASALRRFHLR